MSTPGTWSPARAAPVAAPPRLAADLRPVVLVAAHAPDLPMYPSRPFTFAATHTTADALALIALGTPDVVVIDWDAPGIDGVAVCRAAARAARVLVVAATPEQAPAAIKAGCHEVLLRPLTTSLIATRVGRMLREGSRAGDGPTAPPAGSGTRRVWPELACDRCGEPGAVSFDFSALRRMWYACLACEHVWLGPRGEQVR